MLSVPTECLGLILFEFGAHASGWRGYNCIRVGLNIHTDKYCYWQFEIFYILGF